MTGQRKNAVTAADFIKKNYPENFKPRVALITEADFKPGKEFNKLGNVSYSGIPPQPEGDKNSKGKVIFCRAGKTDVLVMNGRHHYYDGTSMRQLAHVIYVLKELGIKKIISIDEVGHLHPRFDRGEIALVFDHINLMGSSPLIGPNDDNLGLRFPDMSDPYNNVLFEKIKNIFIGKRIPFHESVYLGITGPACETDSEARFYRQILADVLGYSLVPENITAVHAEIKFAGIGLITRNLVADVMQEDGRTLEQKQKDRDKYLEKAQKKLNKALIEIIDAI